MGSGSGGRAPQVIEHPLTYKAHLLWDERLWARAVGKGQPKKSKTYQHTKRIYYSEKNFGHGQLPKDSAKK